MNDPKETPPTPRLMLPFLAPVYAALAPLAWPMVRLFAGLLLMPHGAQKLFGWFGGGGIQGTAAFFAKSGFEPALPLAYAVACTEFFGGLLLAIGLFTRVAAGAIAVFLFVAVSHHLPNGFFWTKGGYEYPLLWGVVALAFVITGGGRLSFDRLLGREV